MLCIGQTVWDYENKKLVCFLGMVEVSKDDDDFDLDFYYQDKDGNIIVKPTAEGVIHILDKNGNILVGKNAIKGKYFGWIKKEYWDEFKPDLDLEPDFKNIFPANHPNAPKENSKWEICCFI